MPRVVLPHQICSALYAGAADLMLRCMDSFHRTRPSATGAVAGFDNPVFEKMLQDGFPGGATCPTFVSPGRCSTMH
jgi:hypothetical protein